MIVCADDYGLSEGINSAIQVLVAGRKLSAVSCMVALEGCTARSLAQLQSVDADLGLHLCLTTDEGVAFEQQSSTSARSVPAPFRVLLIRALTRRLPADEVSRQINAQYELFLTKVGRAPDFIDGHLYVHQFPSVREALTQFVLTLHEDSRPYVRNTWLSPVELRRRGLPALKSLFIGLFGRVMCRRLNALRLPTNAGFAGIYDFRNAARFEQYLPRFIDCLPRPNGLMVVHPGTDAAWRRSEFQALRNFTFPLGSPNRFPWNN